MHPTGINEKIFSHFIAEKIIFRMIIKGNNIFDTNILSRGYLTKLKNYGKLQGVVGGYDKHPLKGNSSGVEGVQTQVPFRGGAGRGGMCIFWNYTFRVYIWQVIVFKCIID